MPFLDEHMRCMAANHFDKGILLSSKMVPTVTLNWRLHLRQFED